MYVRIERIHSHVLLQFKLWIEKTFKIVSMNKKNYRQEDNSRGYIAPPVNVGWRKQSKIATSKCSVHVSDRSETAISYTHVYTP